MLSGHTNSILPIHAMHKMLKSPNKVFGTGRRALYRPAYFKPDLTLCILKLITKSFLWLCILAFSFPIYFIHYYSQEFPQTVCLRLMTTDNTYLYLYQAVTVWMTCCFLRTGDRIHRKHMILDKERNPWVKRWLYKRWSHKKGVYLKITWWSSNSCPPKKTLFTKYKHAKLLKTKVLNWRILVP